MVKLVQSGDLIAWAKMAPNGGPYWPLGLSLSLVVPKPRYCQLPWGEKRVTSTGSWALHHQACLGRFGGGGRISCYDVGWIYPWVLFLAQYRNKEPENLDVLLK